MNSSDTSIQSISIPNYTLVTTSSSSSPHIAYNLSISLPTRHYTIQHRYSDFTRLEQHFLHDFNPERPPSSLPPKHSFSSWFNSGGGSKLTEGQLEERRDGLEKWLRSILSSRDPKWRNSRPFKEFLLVDPSSSNAQTSDDKSQGDIDWNLNEWTKEFDGVEGECRSLRTKIDRRDHLLLSNDSSAHQLSKESKRQLVEIVARLDRLTKGLERLAKEGMTQGELRRRSDMVQRMQGEVEQLGRKTGNAPRIGAARRQGGGDEVEAPSVSRQALLGGGGGSTKATTRVLGAASGGAAPETSATRPLDNEGIMQLQQTYMDDQDSKLETLTAALRRQRHLGEMINQELALQEDVIDQLEQGTDRVSGKIKNASKQMKKL